MTTESGGIVLLVEDDVALREVVSRLLAARGYHVLEAGSAEEAADALRTEPRPALVLLDLNLPGDTGWDLLRGPALSAPDAPPVVVATATTISPKRLAEYRVAGYLPKPYPAETLLATVARIVGGDE